MLALLLKIFNLHFLISTTGTKTKAKIRLSSATDYLEYRQKTKNILRYESKIFVTDSLVFSSIKRKGKSLREVVFLFKKKTKINEMRTPKKENVVPI